LGYERDAKSVHLGERITFQTFRGLKGNIIGRLPDGRMVLFNRDSPYTRMLAPGQSVDCSVNYVSEKYIIVDPIREPRPLEREVPTEPIEREETTEIKDGRFENLRRLSNEGEWETAIIARALIHVIEMFDALKMKPPKRSSPDGAMEEQPIEHLPDSDEFLQAASSFGLTYVKEQKEPESKFLRYLDEYQEEEKSEVETLLSIRIEIEAFGTIADIPKDVRLLTISQTRHLKTSHLRELDGYDDIDQFTAFFVKASALEKREYGNVFYASTGTNSWHKLYKVTVGRF